MLTYIQINAAKPREKARSLSDSQGLLLLIQPNGSKLWRFKYRFLDKQKTLHLGGWPRASRLAEGLNWSAMVETARRRFPKAEVRSLSLPRQGNGLIALRMRSPEEWLPNGRTTLWFVADSGVLVATRDARNLPPVARGYNLLYPLHVAKVGGFLDRLAMTLSGLSLMLLGTLAVWCFWFRHLASTRRSG